MEFYLQKRIKLGFVGCVIIVLFSGIGLNAQTSFTESAAAFGLDLGQKKTVGTLGQILIMTVI